MGKFDAKFENNKLMLTGDTNQDGDAVIKVEIALNEAIQEAFKKNESIAVEGAKVVDFKFNGASLMLSVDSDKDGEKLATIEINLMEALQETGVMD
jgi:fructose-1,6-bisphosphatase